MEVLFERLTDIGAGLLPALGHLLLWVMALAGVLGSLFPAFPGATLIWGAAVAHGVVYGFDPLGGWTLGILTLLTGVSIGGQYVVGALGARRFGASGWGVAAAGVGMLVGTFALPIPVVGSLVGAFVGAVLVEFPRLRREVEASDGMAHRSASDTGDSVEGVERSATAGAARAGMGAVLGAILGMVVEFGTALLMVGVLFVGFIS